MASANTYILYWRYEPILQRSWHKNPSGYINSELSNISLRLKVTKLSLSISEARYIIFSRRKCCSEGSEINMVLVLNRLKIPIWGFNDWQEAELDRLYIVYIWETDKRYWKDNEGKIVLNRQALLTLYHSFEYLYVTYYVHALDSACIRNLHKVIFYGFRKICSLYNYVDDNTISC